MKFKQIPTHSSQRRSLGSAEIRHFPTTTGVTFFETDFSRGKQKILHKILEKILPKNPEKNPAKKKEKKSSPKSRETKKKTFSLKTACKNMEEFGITKIKIRTEDGDLDEEREEEKWRKNRYIAMEKFKDSKVYLHGEISLHHKVQILHVFQKYGYWGLFGAEYFSENFRDEFEDFQKQIKIRFFCENMMISAAYVILTVNFIFSSFQTPFEVFMI